MKWCRFWRFNFSFGYIWFNIVLHVLNFVRFNAVDFFVIFCTFMVHHFGRNAIVKLLVLCKGISFICKENDLTSRTKTIFLFLALFWKNFTNGPLRKDCQKSHEVVHYVMEHTKIMMLIRSCTEANIA